MKYATLTHTAPAPDTIVILSPSAWVADAHPPRPTGDVAVGLRCLSQADILTARAEANKEAALRGRTGDEMIERYNAALMAWAVALAIVDPNDAGKPYFDAGDEELRRRLTPETIAYLWHELERAHLAGSPLRPEATDDDLADLALTMLDPGAWAALSPGDASRVRRLLRFCRDELAQKSG